MRVLFHIYSLAGGGAERVVATLANHLAIAGHQVAIVTIAGTEEDFYSVDPKVERITMNLGGARGGPMTRFLDRLRRIRRLRSALRKFRPRLAIAMMDTASVSLAIAGLGFGGMARVGSERVYPAFSPSSPPWRLLRRWTYGLLHGVVALSEENAQWLRENTLVRRTWIIPNPVVLPLPIVQPIRSPEEQRKQPKRVLAVGRCVPQKGFDLLIEAFAVVMERYQDWELVIVGDGPERTPLQELARQKQSRDRISLVGAVGNIGAWYESADLFVLPSRYEGFPNALLEAMAHGKAVIAADCPTGPRDLISEGINGLLVETDQSSVLARALDRLMGDAQLRQNLALGAKELRDRFSVERIAGLWIGIVDHQDK